MGSQKIESFVDVITIGAKTCVHFMKVLTVYALNSHLLTLKAHNHKMYFLSSSKRFEAS